MNLDSELSDSKFTHLSQLQDRAVRSRLHFAAARVQPRPDDDPEVVAARVHGPARQDLIGHRPQDYSSCSRRKSQSQKLKRYYH